MLTLVLWDVQHGSATYIKTPAGQHIVHGLGIGSYGSGSADFSPLMHLKRSYGVTQLDAVIITHPPPGSSGRYPELRSPLPTNTLAPWTPHRG